MTTATATDPMGDLLDALTATPAANELHARFLVDGAAGMRQWLADLASTIATGDRVAALTVVTDAIHRIKDAEAVLIENRDEIAGE